MSDLIREALENLVRQQDEHPRSLEKLRRQGLSPDHPTITATMEGHRLMMDRAWQQAREAISRTPYSSTRQQEVGSGWKLVPVEPTREMVQAASVIRATMVDAGEWCVGIGGAIDAYEAMLAAAPSTPEKAGGGKEVSCG